MHATVFGLLNNIIASIEICCEFNPLIIIIVMFTTCLLDRLILISIVISFVERN